MNIDIEKHIQQQIIDGYIDEEFKPLKCICGCKQFQQTNEYYDEHSIVEYQLYCTKCGEKVGHWAYGTWYL